MSMMEIGQSVANDAPRIIRKRKINPPASRNPFEIVSEALADLSDRATFKIGPSRPAPRNSVAPKVQKEPAEVKIESVPTVATTTAIISVKKMKPSAPVTNDFKQTR